MRPLFFHTILIILSFGSKVLPVRRSLGEGGKQSVSFLILFTFFITTLGPLPAQAQEFTLPKPGAMVHLSPAFNPPILRGIKVDPNNPFRFDFVLDQGDSTPAEALAKAGSSYLNQEQLRIESRRLIKYFLASITVPDNDLWVNLSPYEKDRIIPNAFGKTEMGRDLLAQDYILKQITASLIYPEDEVGKQFWKRVYEEAQKKYGTTQVPINTFNKVWIVPEKAVVYENVKAGTAYVIDSKLKVMLEQDYLSLEKNPVIVSPKGEAILKRTSQKQIASSATPPRNDTSTLGSQIVREIVIPQLQKEINEGKNFAQLRQVYNSLILATWYKKKIKDSILSQYYKDKNKVGGLSSPNALVGDPAKGDIENIYHQYLQAFKKGVFNYIREEPSVILSEARDPNKTTIPRKYFSGGTSFDSRAMTTALKFTSIEPDLRKNSAAMRVTVKLDASPTKTTVSAAIDKSTDAAMVVNEEFLKGLKYSESLGGGRVVEFIGIDGKKYYLKSYKNKEDTLREFLAYQIARDMGVHVPEIVLIRNQFRSKLESLLKNHLIEADLSHVLVVQAAEDYISISNAGNGLEELIVFAHFMLHADFFLPRGLNIYVNKKYQYVAYDLLTNFDSEYTFWLERITARWMGTFSQVDMDKIVDLVSRYEQLDLKRYASILNNSEFKLNALNKRKQRIRQDFIAQLNIAYQKEEDAEVRELINRLNNKLIPKSLAQTSQRVLHDGVEVWVDPAGQPYYLKVPNIESIDDGRTSGSARWQLRDYSEDIKNLKQGIEMLEPEIQARISTGNMLIIGPGNHPYEILKLLDLYPNLESITVVDDKWSGNLDAIKKVLNEIQLPSQLLNKIKFINTRFTAFYYEALGLPTEAYDLVLANRVFDYTLLDDLGRKTESATELMGQMLSNLWQSMPSTGVFITLNSDHLTLDDFTLKGFHLRDLNSGKKPDKYCSRFVAVKNENLLSANQPTQAMVTSPNPAMFPLGQFTLEGITDFLSRVFDIYWLTMDPFKDSYTVNGKSFEYRMSDGKFVFRIGALFFMALKPSLTDEPFPENYLTNNAIDFTKMSQIIKERLGTFYDLLPKNFIFIDPKPSETKKWALNSYTASIIAGMMAHQDEIKGKVFLDLGAGSGILSWVALALGASKVIMVEKDPESVRKAKELMRIHGYSDDRVTFIEEDLNNTDVIVSAIQAIEANSDNIIVGENIGGWNLYGSPEKNPVIDARQIIERIRPIRIFEGGFASFDTPGESYHQELITQAQNKWPQLGYAVETKNLPDGMQEREKKSYILITASRPKSMAPSNSFPQPPNHAMNTPTEQERLLALMKNMFILDPQTGQIYFNPAVMPLKLRFNLIYARHGQTLANEQGRIQGQANLHDGNLKDGKGLNQLNPTGIIQARELATRLIENLQQTKPQQALVIITSLLFRTDQTAAPFLEEYKGPVEIVTDELIKAGANEINMGHLENNTEAEARGTPAGKAFREQYADHLNAIVKAEGGGESFLELLVRVYQWAEELNRRYEGRTVIVFGHAVQQSALNVLLGSQVDTSKGYIDWRKNRIKNGEHHLYQTEHQEHRPTSLDLRETSQQLPSNIAPAEIKPVNLADYKEPVQWPTFSDNPFFQTDKGPKTLEELNQIYEDLLKERFYEHTPILIPEEDDRLIRELGGKEGPTIGFIRLLQSREDKKLYLPDEMSGYMTRMQAIIKRVKDVREHFIKSGEFSMIIHADNKLKDAYRLEHWIYHVLHDLQQSSAMPTATSESKAMLSVKELAQRLMLNEFNVHLLKRGVRKQTLTLKEWDDIETSKMLDNEDDQVMMLARFTHLKWSEMNTYSKSKLKSFVLRAQNEFPQFLTKEIIEKAFNNKNTGVMELIRSCHPYTLQALRNPTQVPHHYRRHEGMYYWIFAMKLLGKANGKVTILNIDPHSDVFALNGKDTMRTPRNKGPAFIVSGINDANWASAIIRDGLAEAVVQAYGDHSTGKLTWSFIVLHKDNDGRIILGHEFSNIKNILEGKLKDLFKKNIFLTVDLDQFALTIRSVSQGKPLFLDEHEIKNQLGALFKLFQSNNLKFFPWIITADSRDYLDEKANETWIMKARHAISETFIEIFKIGDNAQSPNKGGIDLTTDKVPLEVKIESPTQTFGEDSTGNDAIEGISAKGGSASGWKFNLDQAMIAQLKNSQGFVPVIINIEPMTDLRRFLGLAENSNQPATI